MPAAEVFKALGDPIRLEMVQRLSISSFHTVNSVSTGLGISRQGARKHLEVLVGADLITLAPRGREVEVALNQRSFILAKQYIARLEQQWERRLEALRDFVETDSK